MRICCACAAAKHCHPAAGEEPLRGVKLALQENHVTEYAPVSDLHLIVGEHAFGCTAAACCMRRVERVFYVTRRSNTIAARTLRADSKSVSIQSAAHMLPQDKCYSPTTALVTPVIINLAVNDLFNLTITPILTTPSRYKRHDNPDSNQRNESIAVRAAPALPARSPARWRRTRCRGRASGPCCTTRAPAGDKRRGCAHSEGIQQ